MKKLFSNLNKISRNQKVILLLFFDLMLSITSTWISFFLLLDHTHQLQSFLVDPSRDQISVFLIFILVSLCIFFIFRIYGSITRYINFESIIQIGSSIICIAIVMFTILFYLNLYGVPRSISIVQPLVFFIFIVASRLIIREIFKNESEHQIKKNILIFGAGEAGIQAYNSISSNQKYKVIAFIDEDNSKLGYKINNIQIISNSSVKKYLIKFKIELILLCVPSLNLSDRRRIVDNLSSLNVRVKTLPSFDNILNNNISYDNFDDLGLDEILERKPKICFDDYISDIKSKTILVTGAGGSIGSEISLQLIRLEPSKIILLDNSEYNLYSIGQFLKRAIKSQAKKTSLILKLITVTDKARLENLFEDFRPDFIFHAAAYKHLPLVEDNVIEAVINNVYGTKNIIECAKKYSSKRMLLISTDKAVRSTSVMGCSKRLAEMLVQAHAEALKNEESHLILSMVRFGNVLNSSGSIVPLFRKQINEGGPITITHPDVTRYFMTIPEAVSLVLYSALISKGGEVFVLNMGKPIKIIDLARKMISLSGLSEKTDMYPYGDIEIKYIGLRDGEKMNEELFFDNNSLNVNNDIMIAQEKFTELSHLNNLLSQMSEVIALNKEEEVINILKNHISKDLTRL